VGASLLANFEGATFILLVHVIVDVHREQARSYSPQKSPAFCRRARGFFDSGGESFRLADDHQKR
jgi:hypothetical protein